MSWARCAGLLRAAVCVAALVLVYPALSQEPAPIAAGQQQLLALMRQYAGEYVEKLPNFICDQTVAQFEASRKSNHWHKGDILTSRLLFNEGREHRQLELVNNKPLRPGRAWRTPLVTEGEFGILLSNVLGTAAKAQFSWGGWEMMHGKRLAVFDYAIDGAHSTLSLSLSDLAKAVVPYHGSIYADPETGAIWRITSETSDIPDAVRTKSIATTIDYAEIGIAGRNYLLPQEAKVLMVTDSNHIRNEISFSSYRKFEAESTITFTGEGSVSARSTEHP